MKSVTEFQQLLTRPKVHEGGALESPQSTSQPMKKPKLSKHPISVARAGEDLATRSSKVLVPASRPLREEMSALHEQLQCSLTSQQREQCVTLLFIFIIIIDILKSIDLPCWAETNNCIFGYNLNNYYTRNWRCNLSRKNYKWTPLESEQKNCRIMAFNNNIILDHEKIN
jgi:hypothetical protein